jgi:parvulin-like peptidyl-prolyl isomerase
MKISRPLALLFALFALIVAGCGGGGDVPKDAVAVVDGQPIARADFDGLIKQAKKSYTSQKREFPKAGTPEYQTLKNQAVQFLVQRVEFEQQAKDLDVEVTEKQLDARLAQIKKQYFGGDQKKYEKQLADQGLTDKQVRADIRAQIVSEKIFENVTNAVKVTDKELEDYYTKNKAQYGTPESREVRHILVKTKAQADDLYNQLQDGGDFAALAKKFSQDPGSKENGGKLTISRGQTVAPFDQTAFLLQVGTVSKPVKTEYGYHLIEPLGPVKEAKTTPLKEVKDSIRQQLLQTKKNEAMTKWVDDLKRDYKEKVDYQTGFTPPAAPTTTAATTNG